MSTKTNTKTKKPIARKRSAGPKFDKDGYSHGPSMALGPIMRADVLHGLLRDSAAKKASKKITLTINPLSLDVLSREALRRHQPQAEFIGRILEAHAEILR